MSVIQQIKDRLPLAPFVAPYTAGLKASGPGFFIGRCPFHQTPNDPPQKRKFWVSARLNICGCFTPRCPAYANQSEDPTRKPLDIINFYQLYFHCSQADAISDLSIKAGIK